MKSAFIPFLIGLCSLFNVSDALGQTYINQIFFSDFKIDGSTQPIVADPARNVTYSITLSKPSGYHGAVDVGLCFGTAAGPNTNAFLAGGGSLPGGAESYPRVGWVTGSGGRDYYYLDVNNPGSPTNIINTALIARAINAGYTHIYAVAVNRNSATYANPNAMRGVSAGFPIGLPCISDNFVQNITETGYRIFTAGQTLRVGFDANPSYPLGDVVISGNASVTFAARDAIVFGPGFSVVPGATCSAEITSYVCSELPARISSSDSPASSSESITPESSTNSLRADNFSEQQRNTTAYPNPAAETLTSPDDAENATLVNDQGKTVKTADKSGKLNVKDLPDGLYNLRMLQNGKVVNQRIQVKH
jgi:hypothetical protein